MDEDSNPYQSPQPHPPQPEAMVGPSPVAVLVILFLSIVVAILFSPADPITVILLSILLSLLSLGSYFFGLQRGSRIARQGNDARH